MDYNVAASELIAELREESGRTQLEIAKSLGVTQSTISKIERCDLKLDLGEMRSLCSAIGITLPDFIAMLEEKIRHLESVSE